MAQHVRRCSRGIRFWRNRMSRNRGRVIQCQRAQQGVTMCLGRRLCTAVDEDRVDDVKGILSASPELVECVDVDGNSPLLLVRSSSMVHVLLQAGADVNFRREDGWTALLFAVYRRDPASAELLLRAGADANATLDNGTTALNLAADDAQESCADLLLRYGANVDYPNEDGFTPLFVATLQEDDKMVELLLECGANPNVATKDTRMTPLHAAAAGGYSGIVTALLKHGADPSIGDDQGLAPRAYARIDDIRRILDQFNA